MVFSSLIFLLFFLTALYVCYFIVPRRWRWLRNCVLLVFSLFFYRCGGADYLPLLLASILINYLGGLLAASERPALRKLGLWGAAALGLGLLGWFKYAGFAAENLAALGLPVEVPQIVVDDMAEEEEQTSGQEAEKDTAEGQKKEEASDELQGTLEQINFDIEEVTNRLIGEFQASADLGESYGSLEIHHETVTNNDRYFTLKLSIYQGAGSGFESYKFYTIDKKTGKQIQLGDLFQEDSDYNERLSENIKDQMRAKMKEDENSFYWVDYEDVPEWNFERLKDDQNFYFDEAGNIVISFDEYEVAPGYMGASEFTVELEVFEDILK